MCVYHGERKVVDVWGGTRDREDNPWLEDTTAPSFSTTKGVMSTLVHILVDQGLAAYDDPIAKHWPEFAANGKGSITIRQALCHEAGLYRIDEMITHANEILDWDHMKALIAAARPVHEPGAHHGYHALTYGWLIGGIIEAVTGKPLQRVLQEELVDPLGLDGMFIGMPHNEMYRRAKLITRDGIMTPLKETGRLERLGARMDRARVREDRYRVLRVSLGDGAERTVRLERRSNRAGDHSGRERSVHRALRSRACTR